MNTATGLEIQLIDESGKPVALGNVSIEVVLFANQRERYRFDVGTSGPDGGLSVPFARLDSIRKDNQSIALMDYNTKLEECDDEILVRIPPLDELRKRLDAAQKWFPAQSDRLKDTIATSNNDAVIPVDQRFALLPEGWTKISLAAKRR